MTDREALLEKAIARLEAIAGLLQALPASIIRYRWQQSCDPRNRSLNMT